MGVRGLLCDNCNFPFRAFSPLPPKARRPRQSQRKADVFPPSPVIDLAQIRRSSPVEKSDIKAMAPPEKLGLRVVTPPAEKFEFLSSPAAHESGGIITAHIAPARKDLRTEITRVHAQAIAETIQAVAAPQQAGQTALDSASQNCPECGASNVRRRRRNAFERTLLAFSDHKAYSCRNCGASFYAKREDREREPILSDSVDAAAIESSCFNVERAEQKG
jgi:transposase-like protein